MIYRNLKKFLSTDEVLTEDESFFEYFRKPTRDFTKKGMEKVNVRDAAPKNTFSLEEHDKKYHGGHYDPKTMKCKVREALEKGDSSDKELKEAEANETKKISLEDIDDTPVEHAFTDWVNKNGDVDRDDLTSLYDKASEMAFNEAIKTSSNPEDIVDTMVGIIDKYAEKVMEDADNPLPIEGYGKDITDYNKFMLGNGIDAAGNYLLTHPIKDNLLLNKMIDSMTNHKPVVDKWGLKKFYYIVDVVPSLEEEARKGNLSEGQLDVAKYLKLGMNIAYGNGWTLEDDLSFSKDQLKDFISVFKGEKNKIDGMPDYIDTPAKAKAMILERLEDANYHSEYKALVEGRYDDVLPKI